MPRTRQARKCRAHRKDGEPCGNYAIAGGRVCRMHGGSAPQVRRKARERIVMARAYRAMLMLSRSPAGEEHREMRQLAFPTGDTDRAIFDAAARAYERER